MRMNRRNVLVGLGTIVAGGGAALGTGAFSTVEADRDVDIEVADDADAFLAIKVHSSRDSDSDEFVEDDDGVVRFDFEGEGGGLNNEAVTRFDNLITIEDNRDEDADDTVEVTITPYDDGGNDDINGFMAYEGEYDGNNGENGLEDEKSVGDGLDVGFEFDTTVEDQNVDEIDTIQITAETSTEGNGSE